MIGALLLAVATVTGGYVATYTFDRSAAVYARLATGAVLAMAVLAFAGFALALVFRGLGAPVLVLAGLVALLPLVTLRSAARRGEIAGDLRALASAIADAIRHPSLATGVTVLYGLAIVVWAWLVADRTLFATPDGLSINNVNNLGDLPYHMQITASFAYGENFPPQNPVFAGVNFSYHYISDFLAAIFVAAGGTLAGGMFLVTMVIGLSLLALVHRWTHDITGDRIAARVAPLLLAFSGGFGWLGLIDQSRTAEGGLVSAFLDSDTRYTIQTTADPMIRFGNSVTTLLIPQRGLILGMALAVIVFTILWRFVDAPVEPDDPSASWTTRIRRVLADRSSVVAGLATGILPIVHLHTFAVVFGTAFFLGLLFQGWRDGRWRRWAVYVVTTLAVALPMVWWTSRGSQANLASFFGFELGWDRGTHDILTFWLVNTGIFIPLLIVAYAWRGTRPLLSNKLVRYSIPFIVWFIVPNLLRVAPWLWDNIKVLTYWWLGAVPLVALLLARIWREGLGGRALAVGLAVVVMASGALDVARATVGPSYQIFDRDGVALADEVREMTRPEDVILTAPTYNTPMFLTGRRVFMGYAGFLWANGLPYGEREQQLRAIYAGDPTADDLIRDGRIAYILVGPQERQDVQPNDAFLSKYPVVAEVGQYRLYRTGEAE
jgi:hypothetical protein